MSRQVTDNLYIELDYFTPEEYYTYEAVAQSALTAESSLDCEGTVTASGVVVIASGDLPAFATLTAMISHIEGADLVAFAESTVSVDIDRIRSVSSEFSAEAALSANVGKIVQLGSAGARTPKTISVFGDAQVSTVQKKFGLGSIAFDGTGDYLTIPSNTDFAYATGTFTIEMWVYRVGGGANQVLLDQRTANPTNHAPVIFINASNALQYNDGAASVITGATTVPLNAWSHVALSRSGTSTRLFLNGVQQGSTYTDTRNYIQTPIRIGIRFDQSTQAFNGYIDELRVTKGVARYTSNFTAPSAPFVSDANTVLLIHADTNISDDVGFIPQNVSSEFNFDATTTIIEPAGEIVEASGSWTADTSVVATANKLLAVELNLSTEFNATIEVDKIISGSIDLTADFDLTASVGLIVNSACGIENPSEVTVIGSVIRGAQVELSSEFTQTATISHIEGADLFAFAEAQLAIEVRRLRDNNIETSAVFDIGTDAVRTVFIAAAADSQTASVIDASLSRGLETAVTAVFSSTIQAAKTGSLSSNLSADTAVSADADAVRSLALAMSSQVVLAVEATSTVSLESTVDSQTTVTADLNQIKQGSADLANAFTPSLEASAIISNFAILEQTSQLTASVNVTAGNEIIVSTDFAQTTEYIRIKALASSLATETTAVISLVKTALADADITGTTALAVSADKLKRATANLVSDTNMSLVKTYWINKLEGTDLNAMTHVSFAVDNLKNSYVIASQSTDSYLVKYRENGTVEWQLLIDESGQLIVDSSSNPYRITANSITKFNSSGSVVWKRQIATGTVHNAVVDSNNAVWFASSTNSENFFLTKIDSLGNLTSRRLAQFNYTSPVGGGTLVPTGAFVSITQTSSNIVVALRRINTAPDVYVFTVPKSWPSTGSISRLLVSHLSSSNYGSAQQVFRSSAGDYYIIYDSGDTTPVIQRISSSGQRLWAANWPINYGLPVSSDPTWIPEGARLTIESIQGFYLDAVDRLAIAATIVVRPESEPSFYRRTEVLYINSSARIENQFYLQTLPPSSDHDADLAYVNPDGEFYISGEDRQDAFLAWLPPRGEGTGTYVPEDWHYQLLTYDVVLGRDTLRGTVSQPNYLDDPATLSVTTTTPSIGTASSLTAIFTPIEVNSFDVVRNTVNLRSETQLQANLDIIKQAAVNLSSQTVVTAEPYDFTQAGADLSTQATAEINATRIKQFSSDLQVQAFQLSTVIKTGEVLIDMPCGSTLSALSFKTTDNPADLTAQANLAALAGLIQSAQADLTAATAFDINFDKFKSGSAELASQTLQTTQAVKTATASIALAVQAFQLTLGNETSDITANLTATTAVTAEITPLRRVQAELASRVQLSATVGLNKTLSADLQVQAFTLSVGSVTRLDPYYQLTIKPETRSLVINPESRQLELAAEQRGLIINPEPRIIDIDSETRTLKLGGYL